MSLGKLIPIVNALTQPDKLELFKLLVSKIPKADLQVIFSATEHPVGSPYDFTEAADIMKQTIDRHLFGSRSIRLMEMVCERLLGQRSIKI
jgi:3-oxoacyl-[acyl-carrier-protein] synthase III